VKFSHLKLSGFKSFVEPTDLLIKDGLTGIVGPNGCGKSNLVEALRWVMGETSAKNMRGGAMDDVIFAGTTTRPPRNAAEVTLGIDNFERNAPAAYNDTADVDITRRIRRDSGSDYRINGKVCRARDVQLLFADLATGAHSTAIVSQGRVGALINAKPKDRRHLLEEAAGISGLHSRRHEAELRLRAAETNLERVDDVTGQLEQQLAGLKRQARQANRYRNISGHIRNAEAMVLYQKHQIATKNLESVASKLSEAEAAVSKLTRHSAMATTASLKASEVLAPLRQKEAEMAAAVHRLTVERENLDAEEARAKQTKEQLELRLTQIASDMEREQNLSTDATAALELLKSELATLTEQREKEKPALETAQKQVAARQTDVTKGQEQLDVTTQSVAGLIADHKSLNQQLETATQNLQRLNQRLNGLKEEKDKLEAALGEDDNTDILASEIEKLQSQLAEARSLVEEGESKRRTLDEKENSRRNAVKQAETDMSRLVAEEKGLSEILTDIDNQDWPGILNSLKVESGYETALAASLGDELEAPVETDAQSYWQILNSNLTLPDLPGDVRPLSTFVSEHAALNKRLSQIGIVEDADGDRLQRELQSGQRLVSMSGAFWRWDGFTRKAGAKSSAAIQLEQRNRLAVLQSELSDKRKLFDAANEEYQKAQAAVQDARTSDQQAREARQLLDQELAKKRESHANVIRANVARQSRLTVLRDSIIAIEKDVAEQEQLRILAEDEHNKLPDIDEKQIELNALRDQLQSARETLGAARGENERLLRESSIRQNRLFSIEQEQNSWSGRLENMSGHLSQLRTRQQESVAELEAIGTKPQEIADKRNNLLNEIARSEGGRSTARDNLAEAESVLADCDAAAKECQEALAKCREERVRHQADKEHCQSVIEQLTEQTREKLDCPLEDIREAGGIGENDEILPLEQVERRLERLKKERDGMGPVNLRAEIEAQEVDEQLTTLIDEREDLESAIARLRQGIASLNREGRERLLEAFKKVDEHFQVLFKRVFGGGHAHLTLTESDDPLAAGLEIMASPPGKRLQLMSLLSGGEQALTALALLFAVFLTNPAPICVLDEVDAPLDDTNVERLCNLLIRMADNSETRFLVVTHHPITMARMDRLYGVTMAERGISQLVSVDLAKAQLIREDA
jgi:chromosome segregation protein